MTQALELTEGTKTLEIGTGSGYQAAILAKLSREVYTIEIVEPLLKKARKILAELGYKNVHLKAFNGTIGWSENAPFDAIMVTAGAPGIPRSSPGTVSGRGAPYYPGG